MAHGKDPMLDYMPGPTNVRMPTGLEAQRKKEREEWESLGPVTAEFAQRSPDEGPRPERKPKREWRTPTNTLGDNHKRMPPSRLEHSGSGWEDEKREADKALLEAEAKRLSQEAKDYIDNSPGIGVFSQADEVIERAIADGEIKVAEELKRGPNKAKKPPVSGT